MTLETSGNRFHKTFWFRYWKKMDAKFRSIWRLL
jgi:hypothetical protein